ncbi:cupin domain-containing protein [Micromonospora sp. DR5-3]|uniref:cupin domain-containing protein n=1 Tax=unclassified Micromonospora TaxID=2617518 RepID=UPI00165230D6|nr:MULTISPECIES: cupin domain-containing protein [unclassified Micromonospora]MCW3817918.1 cupin domain-containing protein [Micromonospora sp. DR5-3]
MTTDEFLNEHYGRSFVHIPGPADRFASLMTWPALNRLLREQRFVHPRLRLTKDNQPVPEQHYWRTVRTPRGGFQQLDVAQLLRHLRDGSTLVVDSIDMAHAPVLRVKQTLQRWLGAYVSTNLYASWGATHGFDVHWDDHDVFVLQVAGTKRWRIYPPTRPWPLLDDVQRGPKPDQPPTADLMLNAGEMLYLPRGWWHDVTADNRASLHLTFAVLRPTNVDFLAWIVQRLKAHDVARRDAPHAPGSQETHDVLRQLRYLLAQELTPTALSEYHAGQREEYALDPLPTLQAVEQPDPRRWDQDAAVVLLSTNAKLERTDTHAVLHIADRTCAAPHTQINVLERLLQGRPVPLAELIEACSAPAVGDLVTAGLLAVV